MNSWRYAVITWIGVIFFSSTSLASQWAEASFSSLSDAFFHFSHNAPTYGPVHVIADKGFHVSLFCILAILLWQALPNTSRKPWTIILIGAIVGSCSEFLQRFFPDRDPAIRDVIINIGGTVLGILLCRTIARFRIPAAKPREPCQGLINESILDR